MSSSNDKENNNAAPAPSEASDSNPVHKFKFPKLAPGATKERQVKSEFGCFGSFIAYFVLAKFKLEITFDVRNFITNNSEIRVLLHFGIYQTSLPLYFLMTVI